MTVFERWRSTGVPLWLRAWLPSPYAVSQSLHATRLSAFTSGARALLGVLFAAAGGAVLRRVSDVSVGFALHADGRVMRALPRHTDGVTAFFDLLFMSPFGVGMLIVGSLVAGAHRPQMARLATLAAVIPAALLPMVVLTPWSAHLAEVLSLAVLALALASTRFALPLARVAERAVPRALAAVALVAVVGALALVDGAAHWNGFTTLPTMTFTSPLVDAAVVWIFGASLLALSALMIAIARAAEHPWREPESWLDGAIGEGLTLTFANGAAPRQASSAFGAYRGPVVVIPLGAQRKGVFRGDGAPDDGWTVPGTVSTLRDAVRASRLATDATVLAVLCLATAALSAALLAALTAG
jgi:hypothetical protein